MLIDIADGIIAVSTATFYQVGCAFALCKAMNGTIISALSYDTTDYSNFSGSGNSSEPGFGFVPNFPCRSRPFSQDSISPFVWGSLPSVERARWFVVAIESLFLFVGLSWNLFIIASYIRHRKLLKQPANIYLLNLAITDILLSIFVTFTTLTAEAAGEFIFGSSDFSRCVSCQFFGVSMHLLVAVSLHTLAAMSVDRCILLTQPLKYSSYITWKVALSVQLGIWVLSAVIAIPPLFEFGDYEYNLVFSFCNARWTGESGGIPNIVYILFYGLESIVPIFILIFTNIWIVLIAKRVLKQRITRQRTFRNCQSNIRSEEKKYKQQQKQLFRVFGALLVSHVVCWVPVLTVMFVALGLGANNIPPETFIAGWLTFLTNPVVHPIIETFFVQELRYSMSNTKKSIKRASSSLYSQMSSTSLMKSFSRSSRTSLDPPMPAIRTSPVDSATNSNGLRKEVEFSYMQDKAFGHSTSNQRMRQIKKTSVVSFKMDDRSGETSLDKRETTSVFPSEEYNSNDTIFKHNSPASLDVI